MKKISVGAVAAISLAALFGTLPAPAAQADVAPDAPSDLRMMDVTPDHLDLAWAGVSGAEDYLIDGIPCAPVNTGNTGTYRLNSFRVDPNCGYFPGMHNINVRAQMDTSNTAPSNTITVNLP